MGVTVAVGTPQIGGIMAAVGRLSAGVAYCSLYCSTDGSLKKKAPIEENNQSSQ